MPSTYTTNLNIEKPATGEQLNTWGTTVNINFDILDQSINGITTITLASAGTSGSPNTLPIPNRETSEGRNKYITFTDGGSDLGADAYVQLTPSIAQKIAFIRNNLSANRNIILFQGTYAEGRRYVLAPNESQAIAFSGGATPVVTKVTTPDYFDVNNLTDVTVSSPSNGQVISYNSETGNWENTTPSYGSVTLSGLSDVNVGDISDGQVLAYNAELSVWSNTTPSSGSGTLSGLSDVNVGDISDGQVLAYNAELNVWSNIDSPSGSTTFSGLSDTDFAELTNNDIAVYDGEFGAWINRTLSLDTVTDSGSSTTNQITVGGVNIGSWTIQLDGSDLRFIYNGTDVFRITTAGAIIAKDDVTAFGAP